MFCSVLKGLKTKVCVCISLRWKNWWVRGILTLAMISFFFFIIYLGPMVLMMIVSTNYADGTVQKLRHLLSLFPHRKCEIVCVFFVWLHWNETLQITSIKCKSEKKLWFKLLCLSHCLGIHIQVKLEKFEYCAKIHLFQ